MSANSKKWILFGYALTYTLGVAAYVALSSSAMLGSVGLMFAITDFLWTLALAIGFVLLVGILDILTERRPQPLSALSLGLAVFVTLQLTTQIFFAASMNVHAVRTSAPETETTVPDTSHKGE